jgi:integrase
MTTPYETTTAGEIPATNQSAKINAHSAKLKTWRKRGTNLVQHVSTGTFYARIKYKGKTIRASLKTKVLTVARERLPDKIKQLNGSKAITGTFGQYLEQFKARTNSDASLSPEGKKYRLRCADRLEKSWPELLEIQVNKITESSVENWWNAFSEQFNPQFVNHTLVYFRYILRKLAKFTFDPTADIKPVGVKPKKLILPSTEQFKAIIESVRANGSPEAQDSADMIEFLAYSGCRISEAQKILWQDVDWQNSQTRVPCAKRRRSSNEDDFRFVPMIPPMKTALERMKSRRNPQPQHRVNLLDGCRRSLTNACKRIGCPRLTHHDLRHFFASVCIESGVDIQTISRWLGHSDGGVLAQRIYGHLRKEHSQAMAARVTFGQKSSFINPEPSPGNFTPPHNP